MRVARWQELFCDKDEDLSFRACGFSTFAHDSVSTLKRVDFRSEHACILREGPSSLAAGVTAKHA